MAKFPSDHARSLFVEFGLAIALAAIVTSIRGSAETNYGAEGSVEAAEDVVVRTADSADLLKVEDDCRSIRQKLWRIRKSGGTVYIYDKDPEFPERPYLCKSAIVLDGNHTKVLGVSRNPDGRVRIRLVNRSRSPLFVIGTIAPPDPRDIVMRLKRRIRHVELSGFDLDGNRLGMLHPKLLTGAPLYLQIKGQRKVECWGNGSACDDFNAPTSFIRNNGVTIRAASFVKITNIHSHHWSSGGLVTEKDCDHLQVDGFESSENIFDGFAGYQTTASTFDHLDLHHNYSSGISLDLRFDRNVFRNSKFHDNYDNGIFARYSDGNVVENSTVENNCHFGVYLASAGQTEPVKNWIFRDLTIARSGRDFAGSGRSGVRIADPNCTGNSFQNVRFERNPGRDFRIAEGNSVLVGGTRLWGHEPVSVDESLYTFAPECDHHLGIMARADQECRRAGGYIEPGGTDCLCPGVEKYRVAEIGGMTCHEYFESTSRIPKP